VASSSAGNVKGSVSIDDLAARIVSALSNHNLHARHCSPLSAPTHASVPLWR